MEAGRGLGMRLVYIPLYTNLITWCCLASLSTAGLSSLHNHFCCWWSSSYCMGKTCTWPFKPTSCTYSKWHCDSRNFLPWNPKWNKRIYRYTVILALPYQHDLYDLNYWSSHYVPGVWYCLIYCYSCSCCGISWCICSLPDPDRTYDIFTQVS